MTRGSWNHEAVSRHFGACPQCRELHPEEVRLRQPFGLRRTVPEATLAAMCSVGRSVYQSYLRWLAEPDA